MSQNRERKFMAYGFSLLAWLAAMLLFALDYIATDYMIFELVLVIPVLVLLVWIISDATNNLNPYNSKI